MHDTCISMNMDYIKVKRRCTTVVSEPRNIRGQLRRMGYIFNGDVECLRYINFRTWTNKGMMLSV